MTDKDIGAGNADTLGLGETGTTTVGSDRQVALAVSGTHTISGTAAVTIASTKCNAILFFCVHVTKGNNGKYLDKVPANNWKCKDISTQKRCTTGRTKLYVIIIF